MDPLPPRPGTAGNRPGTSSGVRSLAVVSHNYGDVPDFSDTSSSIFNRVVGEDGLLRIMADSMLHMNNEAIVCSENGNIEGILKLHEQGFDFAPCRGMHGYSPLHHASAKGHALVVSELLRLRVPIDVKNDDGETPLHLAALAGNLFIVEQLIDKGSNINVQNNDKETPLFYAARKSNSRVIRLLLQHGANPEIEDKYGDKAIDLAPDAAAAKAFKSVVIEKHGFLSYECLLHVYSFLKVADVLRCACVSVKWHRVSENETIWQRLGVRRWELALQNSLGFAPSAAMSFFRRPSSSKNNSQKKLAASTAEAEKASSSSSSSQKR
jgi:hypothetical protein